MRSGFITLLGFLVIGIGNTASAENRDRDLDFSGGLVFNEAPSDAFTTFPGVTMEARYFATELLYLSGIVAGDLGIDARNPEHGNAVPLLGLGVGGGLYEDFGARVTAYVGGRIEWLHAWDWPEQTTGQRDFHTGLRGGPTASLGFAVGSAFGHPMSLEARLSYLYYRIPAQASEAAESQTHRSLCAGVFITGVLFPEPASGRRSPSVTGDDDEGVR